MVFNYKKKLPLRMGVGIVLLNSENKVFVGKRIDNPGIFWQMPQGGVDNNEKFSDAALRELNEETSIKSVEIIKEIENWYTYELPGYLLGKIWKGKYKGQKQKWFIMKFIGKEKEINLNTKRPEFLEWKWVEPKNLTKVVVNFKLRVYKEILKEIEKILN
tara:strand:- start:640 stop:1119 length:480 start_codon:yes stop_codon:yes gene_type:complete